MILEQLRLRNFCLFRGRQTFDLSPRERSGRPLPIILFGGLNGGGKTTLLDAIQLALYGSRARCSKRAGSSYDEFLRQSINHGVSADDGASVVLSFRYFTEGEEHLYEICRTWQSTGEQVREELRIFKDGSPDAWLSDHWTQLVEELIPLEVSQLFFFDAEKIRSLAEDESSSKILGTAIKALLGLDIVERLVSDATVLQTRLARDAGNKDQRAQIEALQQRLREVEAGLGEASSEPTIAIVGTFRASLSDTIRYVNYHLNAGIDHLFLFFDDPADPAIDALAEYKHVSCFRCDERYWSASGFTVLPSELNRKQIINADTGLRLAREMGIDWITHIDSDELLYANEGIAAALSRIERNVEVISFQVLEAVPDQLEYACMFEQVSLFKRTHRRLNRVCFKLARSLGCQDAFYYGEYFRGHQCKTAVRTCASVKSMGIHEPIRNDDRPYTISKTRRIKLLHYDACAFSTWKRKWSIRLDGTISVNVRGNRKQQWDEIDTAFREGESRVLDLYKKMHFVGRRQRLVLRCLGLLMTIRLNRASFEPMTSSSLASHPESGMALCRT